MIYQVAFGVTLKRLRSTQQELATVGKGTYMERNGGRMEEVMGLLGADSNNEM